MDTLIIFCAQYLIYVVAAVALIYLVFSPEWKRLGIEAVLSLIVAFVVGKGLGLAWYDPLPFVQNHTAPLIAHAANNGFPSDHMLLAATLASVAFVYNRWLGVILWILAIVVGAARVLAGVHHAVDVLAAAIIAIAAVWLVHSLPLQRVARY